MFGKLKQKLVAKASAETAKEIVKSSNEGRIRTISTIAEGVILFGLIMLSAKGGGSAAIKPGITIILNNSNIIFKGV